MNLLEAKTRSDVVKKYGPPMDRPWTAQCSVGEVSIGKDRLVECSTKDAHTDFIKYRMDNETLSEDAYQKLVSKYSSETVDSIIDRILGKPYHGCLNQKTISEWCEERRCVPAAQETEKSIYADRLKELIEERR